MVKKDYAVLMNRKILEEGIYYYSPEMLMEGKFIEEAGKDWFLDTVGNKYTTIHNRETTFIGVGYGISEEQLLMRYPGSTLEDAKRLYYDEICNISHFGFYIYSANIIGVVPMDLRSILTKLNDMDIPEGNLVQIPMSMFQQPKLSDIASAEIEDKEPKEYVFIARDYFENILASKSYNEVMTKLGDILPNPSVQEYNDFIEKELIKDEQTDKTIPEKMINVRDMKDYFDQIIIGQDDAKKDVISAIVMNKLSDDPINKNSCLLVGPTGSGKTLIAQTVSKYFDIPMEIVDTTQLSMPGYIGGNIEDVLVRLLNKAKGDVALAEEGIIVFDEIDKKGSKENSDVSGKGVLNVLLSFIQGATYNLNYQGKIVPFNTSKLTIFATGAFTDVAKAKKDKKTTDGYSSTNIGYGITLSSKDNKEDIVYEKLEIEDFVKYGNMPIELMGRFSTIAQLSGHTKESLKRILTDSSISPLLSEQNKLSKANIWISWDESYLDAVTEEALKLKTGARSLKSIVERSIKVARWEALLNLGTYNEIRLNDKTVLDSYNCELVDVAGNVINLQDIISKETELKRQRKL